MIGPMKFGRIKRQHGRVGGLDESWISIVENCPHVTRIVPGRIKVRRGQDAGEFQGAVSDAGGAEVPVHRDGDGAGGVPDLLGCRGGAAVVAWMRDAPMERW